MYYLARGWHPDGSWPVVVQIGHLVCQSLELVSVQPGVIMYHNIVSWGHCSLIHMLGHQEEVIPATHNNVLMRMRYKLSDNTELCMCNG